VNLEAGWRWLFEPLGAWRTRLLWRAFGVFVNQLFVMAGTLAGFQLPTPALVVHGCGLLLIVFGPRPLLLLAMTGSALVFFDHMLADPRYQVAEEYLPLVVLPLLGLAIALAGRSGGRGRAPFDATEMDAAQVSLFRVAVLAMMFFAALHKLNADFFDPALSCSMIPVPHRLVPWLESVGWLHALMPYLGFAGEAGIPLLLFFLPRLGIPFTVGVMTMIGHQGATPFTALVMVCSLAFLRPEDGRIMLDGLKRYRLPSLAVLVGAVAISFSVFRLIGAKRPWLEYLFFELLICGIGIAFVHVLVAELGAWRAGGSLREGLLRGRRDDPVLQGSRWLRALLVGLVVATVLSGMSPYLGLKFRLSFAMFSNLRVDDDRWNSFLLPRALDMRDHDPYVRVTSVQLERASRDTAARPPRALEPGLYTPLRLVQYLESMRRRGMKADIELAFAGESRRFRDALQSVELAAWIEQMDVRDRLWQPELPLGARQPCIH
jgi:hypothetical protein